MLNLSNYKYRLVILRRLFFPGWRRVRIRSQALKRAKKARQAIGKVEQRVT